MYKRLHLLVALLLVAALLLCGCSSGVSLPTDLGTFKVIHASTMTTYSTMNAASGETLLVVRMTIKDEFDQTRFKSYFAAADNSTVAKVNVGGSDYNCTAVAYQGKPNDNDVEYVLVFPINASAAQSATSFTLTAPNRPGVSIKISK